MSTITYDWSTESMWDVAPPGVGDTLVAVRRGTGRPTGTAYLILAARKVDVRDPLPGVTRMRYSVERVHLDDALRAARHESLVWHTR